MPTRILLLGPVPPETLAALEDLPGGVTILAPADAHELLSRVAAEQPNLIVEGSHAVDWSGSSSVLHQILDSDKTATIVDGAKRQREPRCGKALQGPPATLRVCAINQRGS